MPQGQCLALACAALLWAPSLALCQAPPAKSVPRTEQKSKRSLAAKVEPATVRSPVGLPEPRAEELAHVARYDAAIAPARTYAVSAADAALLREAIAAAGGGKLAEARTCREKIADATARKLVDWYLYRGGYGSAGAIRGFLEANPSWPDRGLLAQRAEEALFSGNPSPGEITEFFASANPHSAPGLAALASAYLSRGEMAKAKVLAAQAWTQGDIPTALEGAFLKRFGSLLTPADHKRRLDRLLGHDSRWPWERHERAVVIRRLLPLLSEAERKEAEARLAVYLRAKNSQQLLSRLPAAAASDWGMAVQKAQALRRQKKAEEAWTILLAAPAGSDEIKPDGWWEERRTNAYAALRGGKPKVAYELAAHPGALSINATKDAAFLAGWLALRQLNDPQLALTHFTALAKAADGPLSHARGNYWLGRTYEALGQPERARESYQAASHYIDTFHGQLARLKLDPGSEGLKISPPATPSPEEIDRFNGSDAVRAAVIAHAAGLDASLTRVFLSHLRLYFSSEAEVAMVAHLAQALGENQTSVRIGKGAVAQGLNLLYYAYPVRSLPAYTPLRQPPETAFLLGIARQESEFNTQTLSGAGARGILQVMPTTARHVCVTYKMKCDIPRLMKDPAYNTMMASAYIADRMQEFGGSYVLTLAGYNAGPGRAREWMKEFGDPRNGNIDAIDWIHRIPFEETREYVQKVLSNIQVYRARLGDEKNALRLTEDLKRLSPAPGAPSPLSAAP
jgi:soluble lytic murein transglycosylase